MTNNNDTEIIGKDVKDIYGSFIGSVVGTVTDIDGTIQSVGVDSGSNGLQLIPDEHLVVQGDVIIYIPKWRLDSQKLIREKQLTLRRLRAMVEIVSEDDEMRQDAEIIRDRYHTKLLVLQGTEAQIKTELNIRLTELEGQMKAAKMLFFDAKIQIKSKEITDKMFEVIRSSTNDIIEHVSHEMEEIKSVNERIDGLATEVNDVTEMMATTEMQKPVEYLGEMSDPETVEKILPEAPTGDVPTGPEMKIVEAIPAADAEDISKPSEPAAPLAKPLVAPISQPVTAGGMAEDRAKGTAKMPKTTSPTTTTTTPASSTPVTSATPITPTNTTTPITPATQNAPAKQAKMTDVANNTVTRSGTKPVTRSNHYMPGTPTANTPSNTEVVFPEPPKQPVVQNSASDDDDWLSRMESQ